MEVNPFGETPEGQGKKKTNKRKQMNIIIHVNYRLNCTKDHSFALMSFSNLISAMVSNVPMMQLNISALEFVCRQMPSLRGSYLCFVSKHPSTSILLFFKARHYDKDLSGNGSHCTWV